MKIGSKQSQFNKLIDGIERYGIVRTITGLFNLLKFKVLQPKSGVIVTQKEALEIHFDYPTQFMPTLAVFRELVEPEYEFLQPVLTPNSVFVDVGGGIGSYSVFVAKLIPGCSIHTFEPLTENLQAIQQNLAANSVADKIKLNPVALSSKEGLGSMQKEATLFLSHLNPSATASDNNDNLIPLTTLDAYCRQQNINMIDVLKIDVEGHEPEVMKGATELLNQRKIKVIILEVNPKSEDFYQSLEEKGFQFFYYNYRNQSLIKIHPVSEDNIVHLKPSSFSSNFILIQPDALNQLQDKFQI